MAASQCAGGLCRTNQPATEQEIAEAEQVLGIKFPQDVRQSYLRHNGQAYEAPWMFYDWEWLSLARAV